MLSARSVSGPIRFLIQKAVEYETHMYGYGTHMYGYGTQEKIKTEQKQRGKSHCDHDKQKFRLESWNINRKLATKLCDLETKEQKRLDN